MRPGWDYPAELDEGEEDIAEPDYEAMNERDEDRAFDRMNGSGREALGMDY